MNIKESLYSYFPCAKEEPTPSPPAVNWNKVAKIALIGAGAIAIGVTAYHFYTDLPTLHNRDLVNKLAPICKDAVEKYCKPGLEGGKVCLKDYLVENWRPQVTIEYGQYILCPVEVRAADCAVLVGQPTVAMWNSGKPHPFVFIKNYESITTSIPKGLSSIFKRAIEHFHSLERGSISFKSHIFCSS